ncbi:RNA polymerase rbp1 incomplete domain containing protein [Pandoravirus macleodensis]|uniref:RNA polymerase rbp1 incomplete domain containing protein n=1 Tax=Pandoravirus macleodensis TaxID=2107707 RepID=A0A2U7UFB6_9VIRU|nr:RNA polymerase rbp1 incomplete domain containing protein [Pandoravirus macleodensis]AVK77168.1 RNA polymerase rbp1 incomplete domain containing protein [Pandoravirus macleodensis]
MSDTLPAEMMCAVFAHLPDPWWIVAARACRWWRACIEAAAASRGHTVDSFLLHLRDGHTLGAAVQGGHTNVVVWLAGKFGLQLDDAVATAAWMAADPGRPWGEAVVDAVRHGAGAGVVAWIARHTVGYTLPIAASVTYDRNDCIDAMARDRCIAQAKPLQSRVEFPRGPVISLGTRPMLCIIAGGKFRRVDLDAMCTFGVSAMFVAALVGVPVGDVARVRGRRRAESTARWLEAHRLWVGHSTEGSRHTEVQVSDAMDTRPTEDGVPRLRAVKPLPWPRMRRPLAHDFLPGGALGTYCDLDDDADASPEKYMVMLLRPLLADPADWAALRRCLPHWPHSPHSPRTGKPTKGVIERLNGKEGRIRGSTR